MPGVGLITCTLRMAKSPIFKKPGFFTKDILKFFEQIAGKLFGKFSEEYFINIIKNFY